MYKSREAKQRAGGTSGERERKYMPRTRAVVSSFTNKMQAPTRAMLSLSFFF